LKYSPYSFSKISIFKCPFKFKERYIKKNYVNSSCLAFDIGNYFHKYLENLFKNKEEFKELNSKYIEENELKTNIEKEVKELKNKKFIRMLLYKASKSFIVKAEDKCKLDVECNPTDLKDKDSMFKGYIDLYMVQDKEGIIVDFKSGKVPDKPDWKQTLFYSLWLLKKYNLDKITALFYYVQQDEYKKRIVLKDDIKKIEKLLKKSIQEIENESEFNKKITPLCRYCEYLNNGCYLTDDEFLKII